MNQRLDYAEIVPWELKLSVASTTTSCKADFRTELVHLVYLRISRINSSTPMTEWKSVAGTRLKRSNASMVASLHSTTLTGHVRRSAPETKTTHTWNARRTFAHASENCSVDVIGKELARTDYGNLNTDPRNAAVIRHPPAPFLPPEHPAPQPCLAPKRMSSRVTRWNPE